MAVAGHDLIEDARVSYNDVRDEIKDLSSQYVAEIIFLLTENKGRSRAERHNDQYWKEISRNSHALFVKICDFMANSKYALLTNSKMILKYKDELQNVRWAVQRNEYKDDFQPMIAHLNVLFMLIE